MTVSVSRSPEISVVLPVFNAENYISESVDSILTQTFSDFELIIIDDGSTDNSLNILRDCAAKDARIILLSRENRGLVETLNEGIELARGNYIARMDADDISFPERLRSQLLFMKNHNLDISGSAVECFGARKVVWTYPKTNDGIVAQLLFNVPYAHPSVMCRTEVMRYAYYSTGYPTAEDYDLWQRVWAAGFRGGNTSDVLLKYRVHSDQTSKIKTKEQMDSARHVRRRHWSELLGGMEIGKIDYVLEAIEGVRLDMKDIYPILESVERIIAGEGHAVLEHNAFRLACLNACATQSGWQKWGEYAPSRSLSKLITLWLLERFPIDPQGSFFDTMKTRYLTYLKRN